MPGQGLSHLRRDPGPIEAGDVHVSEAVEVGVEPAVVAIAEEIALLATLLLGEVNSAGEPTSRQTQHDDEPYKARLAETKSLHEWTPLQIFALWRN
jgi:hypothetical protein